jgi:hypothetical protein
MSPEIEGILREGFSSMLKAICAGVPQPDPGEMWERFRREELGPMLTEHPLPPLPVDEETSRAWGDYMHAWLLLTLGMRGPGKPVSGRRCTYDLMPGGRLRVRWDTKDSYYGDKMGPSN